MFDQLRDYQLLKKDFITCSYFETFITEVFVEVCVGQFLRDYFCSDVVKFEKGRTWQAHKYCPYCVHVYIYHATSAKYFFFLLKNGHKNFVRNRST
jgi:hypothetical protein